MEEDEPVSSSKAPMAPALDKEEGLWTPVAGPRKPSDQPTYGMPNLHISRTLRCHVWLLHV